MLEPKLNNIQSKIELNSVDELLLRFIQEAEAIVVVEMPYELYPYKKIVAALSLASKRFDQHLASSLELVSNDGIPAPLLEDIDEFCRYLKILSELPDAKELACSAPAEM